MSQSIEKKLFPFSKELRSSDSEVDILVEEEPVVIYEVKWRTVLAVFALSLSNVCAALSNTTNTTIHFQIAALGNASLAPWIGNANFIVTLAFGPVLGFISDRVGKKWIIVAASCFGLMGSIVSGSAQKTTTIIIGNVFTGLANAGCIMGIPAAQEVTPNKLRPWTMGFSQAYASVAVIAGTVGGGAFVKFHTWRWSYYLNGFVYGASAVLVTAFYHPPPTGMRRQSGHTRKLLATVDYVGILLFTGSIASLVIALTWGGVTYPWNSPRIIAALTVACVGFLCFGLYERFGTKEGILDHRMFYTRNFPILLFVCVIDGMLLLGVNVLFAQQIAAFFTTDAVKIATVLTPYLATSAFGCIPAGMFMARTKGYRVMLISALAWCSVFTGLMALINPNRLSWAYAFSALFGIGTAVTTVIPIVALVLSVPSFLLGTAGTLSVSCRALGGIIGITMFTAILNNKLASALPPRIGAVLGASGHGDLIQAVIAALMSQNPVALSLIPDLPKELLPAILGAQAEAETYSWKFVWIAISVLVAVNAVLSCFLEPVGSRMNNHIESALEESEVRKNQMGAGDAHY